MRNISYYTSTTSLQTKASTNNSWTLIDECQSCARRRATYNAAVCPSTDSPRSLDFTCLRRDVKVHLADGQVELVVVEAVQRHKHVRRHAAPVRAHARGAQRLLLRGRAPLICRPARLLLTGHLLATRMKRLLTGRLSLLVVSCRAAAQMRRATRRAVPSVSLRHCASRLNSTATKTLGPTLCVALSGPRFENTLWRQYPGNQSLVHINESESAKAD